MGHLATMEPVIRLYRDDDADAVVGLSLGAWAPVFDSIREATGPQLFERLHGDDWRRHQQEAVEAVVADHRTTVWIAEVDGAVAGFVAAVVHVDRRIGEITMLAVAPEHQARGLGASLTRTATDWIRDAGIAVAMVETGGDAGHAPARRTYEQAGYTLVPVARYFKAL